MPTGTLGSLARDYPARNSVLSAVINLANLAPSQSFKVGTIPAGSCITRVLTCVGTAFNYGTNNNISVGNASGGAQIVAAAAVGGVGANTQTVVAAAAFAAADTDVWITGAFTGTTGTTGSGFVWVEFASPTAQ
jgi:hypothetical protein